MLIFEPMLIFARVRYTQFYEILKRLNFWVYLLEKSGSKGVCMCKKISSFIFVVVFEWSWELARRMGRNFWGFSVSVFFFNSQWQSRILLDEFLSNRRISRHFMTEEKCGISSVVNFWPLCLINCTASLQNDVSKTWVEPHNTYKICACF